MSGVAGVAGAGGGAMSVDRVMQLRAQILERNQALQDALKDVNATQNKASALSESYERGETVDIAKVMLARQQASVGFEATLQVRNKLLSAYKDIMSMPV
jgi:flagellar hook-basal body complex protein FliE